MMRQYLAGVDIGTTGTRCIIFNLQGAVMGSAYREYGMIYPQPGWAEQDAETLLGQTMLVCKAAIAGARIAPEQIVGIGFSTQRCVTCAVDRYGALVRPLISWQDLRTHQDMDAIVAGFSPERYCDVTGIPMLIPNLIIAKILWMRQNEPWAYERAVRFPQLHDLVLKAFGADEYYTDIPDMAAYGAWDIRAAGWNQELLDRFQVSPDLFGRPVASGQQVGVVSPLVAERTGLAAGTPLCAGGYDQTCGIIGMGAINSGMATVNLGTAGVAILTVDQPITALGGLFINHHGVPSHWQVEGVSYAAASAYRWLRNTIGAPEDSAFAQLNALAASAPPGSNGVLFLPYLNSGGTPAYNPHARAAFIGMSMNHGRAELARAVMEGVALEMRDIMAAWERHGVPAQIVRIGGGATHSPLWNQIQADVYGHPVQQLHIQETAALGAAILGGVGAGVFSSIAEGVAAMVHVASTIEPDMARHRMYEELYVAYTCAYQSLSHEVFGRLAELRERR